MSASLLKLALFGYAGMSELSLLLGGIAEVAFEGRQVRV